MCACVRVALVDVLYRIRRYFYRGLAYLGEWVLARSCRRLMQVFASF